MSAQSLFQRMSLKARVTAFTLLVFVFVLSALTLYVGQMFRQDLERILGQQQFSTVSIVAADVDHAVSDRLQALQAVASNLPPKFMLAHRDLEQFLGSREVFQKLFNGGTFVTGLDGVVVASTPQSPVPIGLNLSDRDYMVAALAHAQVHVGRPEINHQAHMPVVIMAAPVLDAQGKVIGALMGATDLGAPNFLDVLTQNRYGQSGGYFLVARAQGLVIAATDKHRIMQPISNSRQVQRYVAGFEGSGIHTNSMGVEVLTSAKGIQAANWFLAASLPTAEAFAPLNDMQKRMAVAAIVLSALACGFIWWFLRRQLYPVLATVERLSLMADEAIPLQSLPVGEVSEVGELIGGVNRVLRTLEQREHAWLESEKRFELFMNALPAAAFIKNGTGNTLFANRYMEEVLGASGWRTQSTMDLFPPEIAARMVEDDRRAIGAGNVVVEEAVPDAHGHVRLYETHKFAIPQSGGAALLGGIAMDITDRKHAENNLRAARLEAEAAKVQAEAANDAKSRFLAAASHDLRQPLAAVSLYVEMLNNPAAPDKLKLASRIRACVVNLNELLDDVLDVSKLDAGVVVPVLSDFSLQLLSHDLLQTHGPVARAKGLIIHWEPSDFIVRADRMLLQRMLGNLIHNAVKFTDQGGVLLAYRYFAGKHWIEVSDTGLGIAQDRLEHIFERFGQFGNSARNRGSGLGLAIVSKSAAVMGLQLRVESRLGRGSMFAIELLEGGMPPVVEPARVVSELPPLTLGVVDDNRQVLDALELALKGAGHAVFCGSSGKEMFERLGGRTPDAIVSDYRLGETESGFDVIAAARAAFGASLPALIITGDTDPALVRTALGRGIEILYKPVDMDALNTILLRHLGAARTH